MTIRTHNFNGGHLRTGGTGYSVKLVNNNITMVGIGNSHAGGFIDLKDKKQVRKLIETLRAIDSEQFEKVKVPLYELLPTRFGCPCSFTKVVVDDEPDNFKSIELGNYYDVIDFIDGDLIYSWEGDSDLLFLYSTNKEKVKNDVESGLKGRG